MHPVIAIDGTAASGKSSLAKDLARKLGYVYVNTGEMYRGVTWWLLQKGVPVGDAEAVERALPQLKIECDIIDGKMVFAIDGADPTTHARDAAVNENISMVAAVPAVRALLVALQQPLALKAPLVMEGRDIGTVVFPATPYKFYIDADPQVRAARRERQGEADVVAQRDKIDSSRKTSPLQRASNAMYIDTTNQTTAQTLEAALQHLEELGFVSASK
jgi:cytidylate kinase